MIDTGEWHLLCELEISSGRLGIVSAFAPLDREPLACAVGKYGVYYQKRDMLGYTYITAAKVTSIEQGTKGNELDTVAVDHAKIGVFDYANPREVIYSLTEEASDAIFEEIWSVDEAAVVKWTGKAGEFAMAVIASGQGDGIYPIYELLSEGKRCGVEIVFME